MDKDSSFKVGAPGSKILSRGYFYFFFLFICYHKSWDRVIKMEDNTSFEEEIMLFKSADIANSDPVLPRNYST